MTSALQAALFWSGRASQRAGFCGLIAAASGTVLIIKKMIEVQADAAVPSPTLRFSTALFEHWSSPTAPSKGGDSRRVALFRFHRAVLRQYIRFSCTGMDARTR